METHLQTHTEEEIDALAATLAELMAHHQPRREVSTAWLAALVREYLGLAAPPAHALMVAALRRTPRCVPRPLWRQKGRPEPEIRWVFVAETPQPPAATATKATAKATAKAATKGGPAKGKALAADISRTMKLKLA